MLCEVNYGKRIIQKHFNKHLQMIDKDKEKFKKADDCICGKKSMLKKIFL